MYNCANFTLPEVPVDPFVLPAVRHPALDELSPTRPRPSDVIASPQGGQIRANDADVINLCANNYLGLASHPAIREAAHRAIDRFRLRHGLGAFHLRHADVVHKQLGSGAVALLGTEDTDPAIRPCWDANGGLFETRAGRAGRRSSPTR